MVEKFVLYHYKPSFWAGVVASALFSNATLLHLWQMKKYRTWYFIPFIIGGVLESVGYAGRVISNRQSPNYTTPPYILQTLSLLLAPTLFAASIYMILSRLIILVEGDALSVIRPTWLTKIFVMGDILSFLAQCAGGGFMAQAKKQSQITWGERIITAGLVIQILFFGFFMLVTGIFHQRISRYPTGKAASAQVPWRSYFWVLYAASMLIMIRSVFRVVEYVQGNDGFLLKHEYYLYGFDGALMFVTMAIFNIWHPSRIIAGKRARRARRTRRASTLTEFPGRRTSPMNNRTSYHV